MAILILVMMSNNFVAYVTWYCMTKSMTLVWHLYDTPCLCRGKNLPFNVMLWFDHLICRRYIITIPNSCVTTWHNYNDINMTQLWCHEICHKLVQSEVFLVVKKKLNLCLYDKWYFCSQQKNFFKILLFFFLSFFFMIMISL